MKEFLLEDYRQVLQIGSSFGGRQSWFSKHGYPRSLDRTACGVIAAANLLYYLSRKKGQPYFQGPPEEGAYIDFAFELAGYLKPGPLGIMSLTRMNAGLKKFTLKKGAFLMPMQNSWPWNLVNTVEYLKSALAYNSPVLLMSWKSRNRDLAYHWVTVLGLRVYDDGQMDMICSNWGQEKVYDFRAWLGDRSLYKAMIYYL